MLETIAKHFPLITRLRCELDTPSDPDDIDQHDRREAIVASEGANTVVEEPERADIDVDCDDGDRVNDLANTIPDLQTIADPPKRMRVPLIELQWPPSRIQQHEPSVVLCFNPPPRTTNTHRPLPVPRKVLFFFVCFWFFSTP